ncbi:MAG: peptidoglycan-binding protein [Brachymonas sp.]|nr:peptidoglycan-binding protein [Brachymonas sp.]
MISFRLTAMSVAMMGSLWVSVHAQTLGGAETQASNQSISEKCDAPKGTIAVSEPQSEVVAALLKNGLQSPSGLIRMIIANSNCFQVVERGQGFQNMMQERALASGGQMQAGQNVGQGQMVAADFVITPSVVIAAHTSGGVGGGLAGFGGGFALLGAIAGNLKFKEASTSMVMADVRSGIQVAASEGSAKKTDFNVGGFILGAGGAGALGGYTNTAEGKLIAASFLDNWNNIVKNIRNNPSLIQAKAGAASQANASNSVRADAGAVWVAKIAGVKALAEPRDGAREVASLGRSDEVVAEGDEKDGYMKVATAKGSGWVKIIMMRKQ